MGNRVKKQREAARVDDRPGSIQSAPLIAGHALAFGTHVPGSSPVMEDGSWAFVLVPLGDSATRLLVRGRGSAGRTLLGVAYERALYEPAHFAMERRMMIGLKQLAEGTDRHRLGNHVQVVLWTLTFGIFLAAGVLVLRRERWGRPFIAFVAAAAVFQLLTLAQPPLWIGLLLVGLLLDVLWIPPAMGRGSARRPLRASSPTTVS